MHTVTAKTARIAIYGAGAMGTVLGALLTQGGLNVDLITRNQDHVNGLKQTGATVVCEAENREFTVRVNALLPKEMQGEYDVVFLMTKQRHNAEILQFLTPYLRADGVVCTTQNGLPESGVAAVIGKERTYGAATSYGASFLGGGKVALTSKTDGMSIEIGGYENGGEKLDLLAEILSFAGQAIGKAEFVKQTDNLLGARWSKLTINAAFSGLSVVTGLTFGEIAKKHKSRLLALQIFRECVAVAKASGIQLAPMQGHDIEKLLCGTGSFKRLFAYLVLPIAMKRHKKLRSGMLRDVAEGRKCEIDYINGAVVRQGEQVGVETPVCKKIVELVHGIENGLYETSYENVDFLNE